MPRPTIRDVANTAGVSVATVNRVLANTGKVRAPTVNKVYEAAKTIGFYGVRALEPRNEVVRDQHRFGVILQSPHRSFSQELARNLRAAAQASGDEVLLQIEELDDLAPDAVAARMLDASAKVDALAVVAAEHPLVSDAIDRLAARDIPVISLVSPLFARPKVGYVGLDSWKVGRTAAWAFNQMCQGPGKVGLLVGTHRYRCHDLYETGFRSHFREHPTDLVVLEAQSTFESDSIARELAEGLLAQHADLKGIYVSGGGIAGVLAALREQPADRRLVTVGYDMLESTRAGLIDGTLTLVISHPFQKLGEEAIAALVRAKSAGVSANSQNVIVPFELHVRENL